LLLGRFFCRRSRFGPATEILPKAKYRKAGSWSKPLAEACFENGFADKGQSPLVLSPLPVIFISVSCIFRHRFQKSLSVRKFDSILWVKTERIKPRYVICYIGFMVNVRPADKLTAINVVIGQVVRVRPHPNGDHISIADVIYGPGKQVAIIFGGIREAVSVGCFVPVAPATKSCRVEGKKMRRRKYRGVYSYGELCSLFELGLLDTDPDQVAILHESLALEPGYPVAELVKGLDSLNDLWLIFRKPILK